MWSKIGRSAVSFSPFRDILKSAAIIVTVLRRIEDESLMMMMIMTMDPVSAGRLQCFPFYLQLHALLSSFCEIESSDALQRDT